MGANTAMYCYSVGQRVKVFLEVAHLDTVGKVVKIDTKGNREVFLVRLEDDDFCVVTREHICPLD